MAMLKNKKKLRRLTRLTSGGVAGRALLTLAVAGMLVSPAMAADWDGTSNIAHDATPVLAGSVNVVGSDVVINGFLDGRTGGTGAYTGTLKILTGNPANKLTIDTDSANATVALVKVKNFEMSDGALVLGGSLDSSAAYTTLAHGAMLHSGLDGGNTTISGGTVNVEDYGLLWQDGAKTGVADSGKMTITGATTVVNLAGSTNGKFGILAVGTDTVAGSLSIEDGAKVAMAAGEFGYIAGDNLVVNGGTIEVADTAGLGVSKMIATTGKFADLAGTGLEITNTTLTIKSTDTKTGLLHVEGDALISQDSAGTPNKGMLVLDAKGKAVIENSGTLKLAGGVLDIKGGGQVLLADADIDISDAAKLAAAFGTTNTNALMIAGGTLTVGDTTAGTLNVAGTTLVTGTTADAALNVAVDESSALFEDAVTVEGITSFAAIIAATNDTTTRFKKGLILKAADATDTGSLTLGDADTKVILDDKLDIQSFGAVAMTDGTLTVTAGGMDVDANGSFAVTDGTVAITGDVTVANTSVFTIAAGTTSITGNMTVGATATTVSNAGTLSVSGNLTDAKGLANTGDITVGGIYKTKTTTASTTDAFTIASTSEISAGAMDLTKNNAAHKAELVVTTGKLTITGLGAEKAFFLVDGKDAIADATKNEIKLTGAGTLTFDGKGGTYAGTISQSAGTLSIGNGTWNIGTIATSAGAVTIGSANTTPDLTVATFTNKGASAGTGTGTVAIAGGAVNVTDLMEVDTTATGLTVSGGTLTTKGLTIAAGVANTEEMKMTGGKVFVTGALKNGANSIAISGGNFAIGADKLFKADYMSLATDVNQFSMSSTGTVSVAFAEGTEFTLDELSDVKGLLMTSGKWSTSGVTVSDLADHVVEVTGMDGKMYETLAAADTMLIGAEQAQNYGVEAGVLSGAAATLTLSDDSMSGNLVLQGATSSDTVTITTAADTTIIGNGGNMVVGGSGTLKKTNIAVATGGALSLGSTAVVGGGFLNGDITNTSTGAGTVNVDNGSFTINGNVDLTTGSATAGVLNLNEAGVLSVTGDVSTNTLAMTGGVLDATSKTANMGDVLVSTALTMTGESMLGANSLTLGTASTDTKHTINGGSEVRVGTLTLLDSTNKSTITVGSDAGAGTLLVGEAALNGNTLFLDPIWKDGDTIGDASSAAIADFAGNGDVDGLLVAGRNSHLTLGTDSTAWLQESFNNSGLGWGENNVTAALGIFAPMTLAAGTGGIEVDGSLTTAGTVAANEAIFAANSVLVVNAAGLDTEAALSSTIGTVTVDQDAKLMLVDAMVGEYDILSGFSDVDSDVMAGGWMGNNLLTSSYILSATRSELDGAGDLTVTVTQNDANAIIPHISGGMAGLVNDLYVSGLASRNSANAGIAFVTRATDRDFISLNDSARTLESAGQMALAGGAPSAAFDSVAATAGAIGNRADMLTPGMKSGNSYSSGDSAYSFGVWGMPMFRSSEISGQKAGGFKYGVDNKMYGGIIGFDVTNPMASGDFRLGVALNIGAGDTKSNGNLAKTKNKYDFWGASIYTGYRLNNFGISADIGYSSTDNDIKQDLPASLLMGNQLTSKVDAHSYTVGLKAEYVYQTSMVDITPSIGIRYIGYRQGSHNVSSQFGSVFSMAKAEMNTWTFPIGVKFSRDMEMGSGWKVSPELNLAIIPAAGDTKLTSKASIPGVNLRAANMTGHVFDGVTGEVGLGLKLAKDNMSFGLNYDFQGGSKQKAHSVFGNFRYTF